MKLFFQLPILAVVLAVAGVVSLAADPKPGDVIYQRSFKNLSAETLGTEWKSLSGEASHGARLDDGALLFDAGASGKPGSIKLERTIPLEGLRGGAIFVQARVRAENVTDLVKPWNGIKLMLQMGSSSGVFVYPQALVGTGTFDWVTVNCVSTVPMNGDTARLVIGLEQAVGKVWFDDIVIKVLEVAPVSGGLPSKAAIAYKGHPLPRLRGAMVSTEATEEDLRLLAEWGVNSIRWQLGMVRFRQGLETPDFDLVLESELAKLDRVLPVCKKYGIYVVLDLHALSQQLFVNRINQDKLVEVWKKMAARYRDNPVIWAYDIANEPKLGKWSEGAQLWNGLAQRVGEAIRTVDPVKAIMVEPEYGGNPSGFITLLPLTVSNVVYSVHMYNPHDYTHARVSNKQQPLFTYPGMIAGKEWNKATLREELRPVIEFQKNYNVAIYVGEFSAIRWAPGAEHYLSDLIDIFEEEGWDWTYHAFREFHGWSVEHGKEMNDTQKTIAPTSRETLLRSWFAKNERPVWTGK
ncbi:MAG: glycoside hydrolase family 5 protein [Opitutaceae bacterium]|jgi:aryl-phospho-beta-D-glucosidase BglC (GH1 family)